MNKISLTYLFILILVMAGCMSGPERPNIILMMADDLGWGDTGFNGNSEISTPEMDKLAGNGMIFTRFYSASPVCSPTRASCLTGRNPYRMNIPTANSGYLPKEEISLAEILKEEGYSAGHFGKWHLGTFTSTMKDANRGKPGNISHVSIPTDHGFDEFFSTESKVPTWDPMVKPAEFDTANGENLRFGWTAPVAPGDSIFYGTRYWTDAEVPAKGNLNGNDSRIIMDRALAFIENAASNSIPFFTVIWFHAPHLPVVVPEDYKKSFEGKDNRTQIYYGSISALDEQIGRLWNSLKELKISNNTLIFFCSDNGPENGTPGSAGKFRGRKRDLYEGGVRVPAFAVWPDQIPAGSQMDYPGFTTDYLPTIVEFLGLSAENLNPLDGNSLKPAILGMETERTKPMGFLYPGKMSWLTHQYKLISKDKGVSFELFDILNDPSEKTNIIDTKPDIAEQLKSELNKWMESVNEDRAEFQN